MIKIKENAYLYEHEESLEIISSLKKSGYPPPVHDLSKDNLFYIVSYTYGFNLFIIDYISHKQGGSYRLVYLENFLYENKFNFKFLDLFGFNSSKFIKKVSTLVNKLALRINHPYRYMDHIDTDNQFIGLVMSDKILDTFEDNKDLLNPIFIPYTKDMFLF